MSSFSLMIERSRVCNEFVTFSPVTEVGVVTGGMVTGGTGGCGGMGLGESYRLFMKSVNRSFRIEHFPVVDSCHR